MLKIGHEGNHPARGWYVEQDGVRIQNLKSVSFKADVDNVPKITLEVIGLDFEIDADWSEGDLLVTGSCLSCRDYTIPHSRQVAGFIDALINKQELVNAGLLKTSEEKE